MGRNDGVKVLAHLQAIVGQTLTIEATPGLSRPTARMKLPGIEEKDGSKRRLIPDHIPRMDVEPTPGADACADCGGRLRFCHRAAPSCSSGSSVARSGVSAA